MRHILENISVNVSSVILDNNTDIFLSFERRVSVSEFKILGIRMVLILPEIETQKGKLMSCLMYLYFLGSDKLNGIFLKHEFPLTIILHNIIIILKF